MKKRKKQIKIAIVCAYHRSEDDLAATTESAMESAGKGATFYAVEDKDESGPGRNRHRGIEYAEHADVIIIIDAHMRFQGDVLEQMAKKVWKSGGMLVPYCHHNEQCSFDGNNGHYYAGARIVFKARDGHEYKPLDAKWSRDPLPGKRSCVMGACYVFRRDWYMDEAGQPLAILNGWGCDEQVLSIAAWMTGEKIEVFDGHVAHRYRPRPPWTPSAQALASVVQNRIAMIQAIVSDATDRRELLSWFGCKEPEGPPTPELHRFREAMLTAKRSWRQWKSFVCEPEELDGKQEQRIEPAQVKHTIHTPNIVVERPSIDCPNCFKRYDVIKLPEVTHTYPNGNRRHLCTCGNSFITRPPTANMKLNATA